MRTLKHVIQIQEGFLLAKLIVRVIWGARHARTRLAAPAQVSSVNFVLSAAQNAKASHRELDELCSPAACKHRAQPPHTEAQRCQSQRQQASVRTSCRPHTPAPAAPACAGTPLCGCTHRQSPGSPAPLRRHVSASQQAAVCVKFEGKRQIGFKACHRATVCAEAEEGGGQRRQPCKACGDTRRTLGEVQCGPALKAKSDVLQLLLRSTPLRVATILLAQRRAA